MTSCHECFSSLIEELSVKHGERQDDEHQITISKYRCRSCGCEFEVEERIEWETEVLRHGSQALEKEFEE